MNRRLSSYRYTLVLAEFVVYILISCSLKCYMNHQGFSSRLSFSSTSLFQILPFCFLLYLKKLYSRGDHKCVYVKMQLRPDITYKWNSPRLSVSNFLPSLYLCVISFIYLDTS